MNLVVLYRGHKDEDYLKSRFRGLSFTENRALAIAYGCGQNDAGNEKVADGFVTVVEFFGEITSVPERGLGNVDKHIHRYLHLDAIRFSDGVIAVLNLSKLRNPVRESAIKAEE